MNLKDKTFLDSQMQEFQESKFDNNKIKSTSAFIAFPDHSFPFASL